MNTAHSFATVWLENRGKVVSLNGARCATFVDWWLRGIYHEARATLRADWSGEWVELTVPIEPSTVDFNDLTRLVVGSHDFAIRVVIAPCNPRYLRIRMYPRTRAGNAYQRAPTLDEHLATMARPDPYDDPPT